MGDITVEVLSRGRSRLKEPFQNKKSVLPGSVDLKQKLKIYTLVKMELQLSVE
jgi:hypothetical protein